MTRHLTRSATNASASSSAIRNQTASGRRLEGYRAAIADARSRKRIVTQGYFTHRLGLTRRSGCPAECRRRSSRQNDDMAAAAWPSHTATTDVPDLLTVVGYDARLAHHDLAELTTIRQPITEMSRCGAHADR
jgi:LacI family transcriptional regulator